MFNVQKFTFPAVTFYGTYPVVKDGLAMNTNVFFSRNSGVLVPCLYLARVAFFVYINYSNAFAFITRRLIG